MNIDNAQKKQKEMHDQKHLHEELPIGALVLVENTADKQIPAWLGPYKISKHHMERESMSLVIWQGM